MTDHTTPASQPELPYSKLCECGCGQKTALARKTSTRDGTIRGQPVRYITGHQFLKRPIPENPNPSGYCMCGCGQLAPLAKQTDTAKGYVADQPILYIKGHYSFRNISQMEPANPSGLCMCGCGKKTTLAKRTISKLGLIKGQPTRYAKGHGGASGVAQPTPRPPEERFWEEVDFSGGEDSCWIWTGNRDRKGYGQFSIGNRKYIASRYAFNLVSGPIPDELNVCHHCDNPSCVNPSHLFLGTTTDNIHDMMAKGRRGYTGLRGERNRTAKLTDDQVREIRRLCACGTTQASMARRFGVGRDTISGIVNRNTWKHIK